MTASARRPMRTRANLVQSLINGVDQRGVPIRLNSCQAACDRAGAARKSHAHFGTVSECHQKYFVRRARQVRNRPRRRDGVIQLAVHAPAQIHHEAESNGASSRVNEVISRGWESSVMLKCSRSRSDSRPSVPVGHGYRDQHQPGTHRGDQFVARQRPALRPGIRSMRTACHNRRHPQTGRARRRVSPPAGLFDRVSARSLRI